MEYDNPQLNNDLEPIPSRPEMPHYYGDIVRILFFIGAALMLFAYPIFTKIISGSFIFVLMAVLLIVLAGLTNHRWKTLFFINAMLSLIIVIVLEIIARSLTFMDHPFLVGIIQLNALIFVIALYYSLRTLRGFLFK